MYQSVQIKKITFKKICNLFLLAVSYLLTRATGVIIQKGFPVTFSIEPTNRCNLSCPECWSGNNALNEDRGLMDLSTYDTILSECSSFLFSILFYFQGEPFLHPNIFNMIREAHRKHIYTITSTNGHFLRSNEVKEIIHSGLDEIIISMDGMDQSVYGKYRIGGELETVKKGIKTLVELKKSLKSRTPKVVVQFLVFSHNQHQVKEIRKWGKIIGVDKVIIKTARIDDFEDGNSLIPQDEYSRYKKRKDEKFAIKGKIKNHCWRCWSKAIVKWNGNILPCCFDTEGTFMMGNVLETNFRNIWKGFPYRTFRERIFTNRKAISMCRNCSEGVPIFVK